MTLVESFVTSKNALFLSSFTLIVKASYVSSPNNSIMPNPDNSFQNGASPFKNSFPLVVYLKDIPADAKKRKVTKHFDHIW